MTPCEKGKNWVFAPHRQHIGALPFLSVRKWAGHCGGVKQNVGGPEVWPKIIQGTQTGASRPDPAGTHALFGYSRGPANFQKS